MLALALAQGGDAGTPLGWTGGSVPTEKEKVILGRTVRTDGRTNGRRNGREKRERETGERKCRKREAPSGTTNDE